MIQVPGKNSKSSGNNRKNQQMGLHQVKKVSQSKGNNRVKRQFTEWRKSLSVTLPKEG
jgi:hypothetical protein